MIDLIVSRRSIRKYKPEKINNDIIVDIIKAAMYAPSARNQQPWHFIIVDHPTKLKDLSVIHPYGRMLGDASHAVLVCGDLELELSAEYWPVDCAASSENLLLAAHSYGLGAVWLGVYPREKRMQAIKKYFRLPQHIQPFSLISLGFPDEKKETPQRFKKERIHINDWNKNEL